MKLKWSQRIIVSLLVSTTLTGATLAEEKVNTTTTPFAVTLGATRVIYNLDSSGVALAVINPQDYPMLVQSKVFAENQVDTAPFVVTPPLFRLDGNQQSRIRVIRTTGLAKQDRETLYWLCVTGIPPKPDDLWVDKTKDRVKGVSVEVQLRVQNCIKLLTRPESLKGTSLDVATSLTWQREGSKLKVTNPTPFYMNLKKVKLGNAEVEQLSYVPPFESRSFPLPSGESSQVQWKIVTDYGGESREYQASLN